MKKVWIILIAVVAFTLVLGLGAVLGGAGAYFLLREDVPAVFASPRVENQMDGLIISYVENGSPAADAGVVRGDILLSVGPVDTNSLIDLRSVLQEYSPGETVELEVLHGDDLRTLSAEIGEKEGSPYLGVSTCMASVGGDVGKVPFGFNREFEFLNSAGVLISQVVEDSPADQAGLQEGDMIVKVNGDEISPDSSLADMIGAYKPGEVITLLILRDGEELEVEVPLEESPQNDGQAYLGIYYLPSAPMLRFKKDGKGDFFFHQLPGMPFDHFTEGDMPFFHDEFPGLPPFESLPEGVENALIVGQVIAGSPAAEAGIQVHDLILFVDGEPVDGLDSFVADIQSRDPGAGVSLTVFREGKQLEINVTLGEHPDNSANGYLGISLAGFVRISTHGEGQDGLNYELEKEFELPGGDA
jgi:S1-C subfamily serine protease